MEEKEKDTETPNLEKSKINADFCRCPFCPCCFFTKSDMDKHISAFGSSKEEHFENYRRAHGRIEHGSANGPE
jgi:hypothetical protein